jgi:hypothetical protein
MGGRWKRSTAGGCIAASLACLLVLTATASSSGAAAKPALAITGTRVIGSLVVVRGRALHLMPSERLVVQRLRSSKWVSLRGAMKMRRRGFRFRWNPPAGADSATLRAVAINPHSGRLVARSRAVTIALRDKARNGGPRTPATSEQLAGEQKPPPEEHAEYKIPADTRLYQASDITDVGEGTTEDQAIVTFAPGSAPPIVSGHVALAPAKFLPDGMFAKVLSVFEAGGQLTALLERASIDEVLSEVDFHYDGVVEPQLVDEEGNPVTSGRGAVTAIRSTATLAGAAAAGGSHSAFECRTLSNVPLASEDSWDTELPFPIEVQFRNTHAIHNFDSGSLITGRQPSFLLQFSGEAVAKVGFTPKSAFRCALSTAFRQNHRLEFHVGTIGPVPVTIYLEPTLSFEVSASGGVSFEETHHFAITLERSGTSAPDFRLAHSTDPPEVKLESKLEASMFAGGDLSVMAGAAYKSVAAQAGIYGAFGPEVTLEITQDHPDCVELIGRLKADFGLRFELWVKRWDFQVASLSTEKKALADPICVFDHIPEVEGVPVDRGEIPPQGFRFDPQTEGSYLTIPAADGWWLTGESISSETWRYEWVDPTGQPGTNWTMDGQPLDFARGSDGAIFATTLTPEAEVRLSRFGAEGPESSLLVQPNSFHLGIQRITGGPSGELYFLPNAGTSGTLRLDPLSLAETGGAEISGDNPGLVATNSGVVLMDADSKFQYSPYDAFDPGSSTESLEFPATHSPGGFKQFSVGEGGAVADIDNPYGDQCDEVETSERSVDGLSWTRPFTEFVGTEWEYCEVKDIDTLPDGSVVYTVRIDNVLLIVTAEADGSPGGSVEIAPDGLNPTTVVDATGTVVTAFTRRFECPEAENGNLCSRAVVVGERDGALLWHHEVEGDRQTMMPFVGFVGRPYVTIGDGQVGVQFYDVPPNSCGSDNCTPFDGRGALQTFVEPVSIGLRPSFVWY